MDGVVFFSRILTGELEDDVRASWMGRQKVRHIPYVAVKDDPTGRLRLVLLHCCPD